MEEKDNFSKERKPIPQELNAQLRMLYQSLPMELEVGKMEPLTDEEQERVKQKLDSTIFTISPEKGEVVPIGEEEEIRRAIELTYKDFVMRGIIRERRQISEHRQLFFKKLDDLLDF